MEERLVRRYMDDSDPKSLLFREVWTRDGKYDRPGNDPAITVTLVDGKEVLLEWYREGKKNSPPNGGPSRIEQLPAHEAREWHSIDEPHREGGPAYLMTNRATGVVEIEEWHFRGRKHRHDGPAITIRTPDGVVIEEKYYVGGQFHREDGPALVEIDPETGVVVAEEYFLHGDQDEARSVYRDAATGNVISDLEPPQPG